MANIVVDELLLAIYREIWITDYNVMGVLLGNIFHEFLHIRKLANHYLFAQRRSWEVYKCFSLAQKRKREQ